MRKLLFVFLFLGILVSAVYAQGTLTLSTYYPAPFGSYDRIRLVPVNPATIDCTGMDGLLILDITDGQLKVCMGGVLSGPLATWMHDGASDEVYLSDDDADSDGTKAFVGIGTQTPAARLDLGDSDGDIRLYDGNGTAHVLGDEASGETDGIVLRTLGNPVAGEPIFVVESSGFSQRLRVEHAGALKTSNYLEVDGAGDSYIAGSLGLGGETAPVNDLDVDGEVVIGSGATYSGVAAAPANGLIVEGDVAIGKTAPDAGIKLDVDGDIQVGAAGFEDIIYFESGGYIRDNGAMLIFGHL